MSSYQSNIVTFMTLVVARLENLVWTHTCVVSGVRNGSQWVYCNKKIRDGRVTMLMYHLAKISRDLKACKTFHGDIKWYMKELINELKRTKRTKNK